MSKENALVELWHILKDDPTKLVKKTLFQWKQLHLRAVWQAKTGIPEPENIIFGYFEKGFGGKKSLVVAYALVDVIGESLRVRALATRVPKQVWGFNAGKMQKLPNGSIALRKKDIKLPKNIANIAGGKKNPIIRFVYQRGEPKYAEFLKDEMARIWTAEEIPFFAATGEPANILPEFSITAKNWSMGITLRGLGYKQAAGPTGVIQMPISWGTSLGLEETFDGIHYAGFGLIREGSKEDAVNPLGMFYLDTLFLDSFSLDPHIRIKVGDWPPDGAFVEFFNYPKNTLGNVQTHDTPDFTKGQTAVKPSDFVSYNITETSGLFLKKSATQGAKMYKPMDSISFMFKKGDQGLRNATDGTELMERLTGAPLSDKEIKDFLKTVSPALFPETKQDQERLALRIFGAKDFLTISVKKPPPKKKDDKSMQIYNDAFAEIVDLMLTFATELETTFKNEEEITQELDDLKQKITDKRNSLGMEELRLAAIASVVMKPPTPETSLGDLHGAIRRGMAKMDAIVAYKIAVINFKTLLTTSETGLKNTKDAEAEQKLFDVSIVALLADAVKMNLLFDKATTTAGANKKNLGPAPDVLYAEALEKLQKIVADRVKKEEAKQKAINAYKTVREQVVQTFVSDATTLKRLSGVSTISAVENMVAERLEDVEKRRDALRDLWAAAKDLEATDSDLGATVDATYDAGEKLLQAIVTKKIDDEKTATKKKKTTKEVEEAKKAAAIEAYKNAVEKIQNLFDAEEIVLKDTENAEDAAQALKDFNTKTGKAIKKLDFTKLWKDALDAGVEDQKSIEPLLIIVTTAGNVVLEGIVAQKKQDEDEKEDKQTEDQILLQAKAMTTKINIYTTTFKDLTQLLLKDQSAELEVIVRGANTFVTGILKEFLRLRKYAKNHPTQPNVVDEDNLMIAAWDGLNTEIRTQVTAFLKQDVARMNLATKDMEKNIEDAKKMKMTLFNETAEKIEEEMRTMKKLRETADFFLYDPSKEANLEAQTNLQTVIKTLRENALKILEANKKTLGDTFDLLPLGDARDLIGTLIDTLTKEIDALRKKLAIPPTIAIIPKLGKPPREILYGSAKPAAAVLYHLGSPGRIDVTRMREDPAYSGLRGPEVSNLSNFSLEFYGSSRAALASRLSLGASIQAENLVPKAVTVDGGRLEQTAFDYYYGAYWVDEYTGFETAGNGGGGKVTSSPGNYITLPDSGAILYHIGASKVGSMAYDFGAMAQQVSFDNPDFEIMLRAPVLEDIEAPPGSSRLSTSGAIILGLRLPDGGGSGLYSLRFIAYAPRLVKM